MAIPRPVGQKRKVGHPGAAHAANTTHACSFPTKRNDRKAKKKERSGFIVFFNLSQLYFTEKKILQMSGSEVMDMS